MTRRWIWPAIAGVAVVLVTGGVLIGLALTHRTTTKDDAAGRQACTVANNWNESRPGFVSQSIVDTIHDQTIHSTNADLVLRGDQLYDAWHTAEIAVLAGDLTGPERDLQALGPLAAFRTACLQAGYGA